MLPKIIITDREIINPGPNGFRIVLPKYVYIKLVGIMAIRLAV